MKTMNLSLVLRKKWLLLCFVCISGISVAQSKIKIACVGNSITAGYGLHAGEDYPSQLQILLGNQFEVHNFGISSRTLLSKGNLPYVKEKQYSEALEWNPDVVIIKLGTNDSKPLNWKFESEFMSDLKMMILRFRQLPSRPKIYLCYPIPVFSHAPSFHPEWGINDSIIAKGIIPKIKMVQKQMHTFLIDLRTPFLGHEEWVFDGIHPNATGANVLAKEVYRYLKVSSSHK